MRDRKMAGTEDDAGKRNRRRAQGEGRRAYGPARALPFRGHRETPEQRKRDRARVASLVAVARKG